MIRDETCSGLDESGLPVHLPMGVTTDGQGPTEPETPHHRACWCTNPSCVWTVALAAERADASAVGDRLRAGLEELLEDWCNCGDESCTESSYRTLLQHFLDEIRL